MERIAITTKPIETATFSKELKVFNSTMAEKFPNWLCEASERVIIGDTCISIVFANVKSAKDCQNNILLNASGYCKFLIHSEDIESGAPIIECLTMPSKHATNGTLKYRKIKGNSVEQALTKLVMWFEKNQTIFENL